MVNRQLSIHSCLWQFAGEFNIDPKNTFVLIIGTPKKTPLIVENP